MPRFFKIAALLAAITCFVWVAVLWHWESTSRNMTVSDIVLYLAMLPLTVIAVLLGLRWAWQGATPRHEAALAATSASSAAGAPSAEAAAQEDAQRHATVQLLAAHVASTAGASPAEVLTAVGESKLRPEPDAELRDADGVAVMCARIASTQPETCSEQLEPTLGALRAQRAEWATAVVGEHVLRALATLAEPLANALQGLRPWAVRLGAPDRDQPGRAPPPTHADARPMVRMQLGWPADWSEFERDAATDWASRQVAAHTDVPLDRFAIVGQAATSGADLWLKADQLLQTLARERRSDILLIAACHSDLSDTAVAALEQAQRLFSPQHRPKGVMPGEAAVALLLANADWPVDPEAHEMPVRLNRPAVLRRDKSVEAAGRVSGQCLHDCAQHALTAARIEPSRVLALVCDADQHSPRGPELFSATLTLLPHLEPVEDMRLIGNTTGNTGVAAALLVIATAAERARADGGPCLALCVGDAFVRLAVVARPADAPLA